MKRFVLLNAALLLTVAAFFSSCKKEPFLNIDTPLSIEFTSDGGQSSIVFHTNRAWTATPTASWCSISEASGKGGDATIIVYAESNSDHNPRNCRVTISMEGISTDVSIKQAEKPTVIPLQSRLEIDWRESTFSIDTQYNMPYTVRIDGDWLALASTRSLSLARETFVATRNVSPRERQATIYFEIGGSSSPIVIVQKPCDHPVLNASQPGFYGLGNIDVPYRTGQDQTGITRYASTVSFRILSPSEGTVAEVSGIPTGIQEGEAFDGSVTVIKNSKLVYSADCTLSVLKKEGQFCWITADEQSGILVKL